MVQYVVSVKREARDRTSLADIVRQVAGVSINPTSPDRALIEVSPQIADELKRRYGHSVIVEPNILHDRLDG